MSSRLNPRDYDLGELRDAVSESPRGDDDRPADGPGDDRFDDLSAIEDLLHEDPGDGPAVGTAGDGPPGGSTTESREPDDSSVGGSDAGGSDAGGHDAAAHDAGDTDAGDLDGRSRAPSGRADGRSAVGRMGRHASRFARPPSRDRTTDGAPRRRGESGNDEGSGRGPSTAGRSDERAAITSRGPDTRLGGFELIAAGAAGDLERPYLERLPDAYGAQLALFEWLEGLVATCGRPATEEALEYYEAVGWLSGGARADLEDVLSGLAAAEPSDPRPLGVADHRESLRAVARLAHLGDR